MLSCLGAHPNRRLSPQAADVAGHPASQADEAEPSPHEAALAVRVGRRVISGMLPPYVMYGLQFGVAVAIATILVVLQPVWVAMSGSSRWIVVTLVIMHMPTIGAMTWKVFNRVGGTVLGCAVAYLQLALAFLINGASWDNSVGKMIVIAVCTSVWAAFCQLNGSRFPPYLEFWRGAGLTASLLVLPVYRTDSAADWTQPGWRFVAVCIGSAIMALVSAVVFPVTARAMARHKLAAALSHVAGLCSRLQTQVGRWRRRRACWYGRLAPAVCCAVKRAGCLPQVRGPALHHLCAVRAGNTNAASCHGRREGCRRRLTPGCPRACASNSRSPRAAAAAAHGGRPAVYAWGGGAASADGHAAGGLPATASLLRPSAPARAESVGAGAHGWQEAGANMPPSSLGQALSFPTLASNDS